MPPGFYKPAAHHLPPEAVVGSAGGRPVIEHRLVLNVLWFVLASGCRWEDVRLWKSRWPVEISHPSSTSRERWVRRRSDPYHPGRGTCRTGRVVPLAPDFPGRNPMSGNRIPAVSPPRLTTPPTAPWARLPADRQQQLRRLLGRLLARLAAAPDRKEPGHD